MSNVDFDRIAVIDAAARMVVETIPAWESVNHLAMTPDGSAVYVTALESASVSVVDGRTFEPLGVSRSEKNPTKLPSFRGRLNAWRVSLSAPPM